MEISEAYRNKDMRSSDSILFIGHMIDRPGRVNPRFPPSAEGRAAELIDAAVRQVIGKLEGGVIATSGATPGGDILFLETCERLGVDIQICLPERHERFSASYFVQESWRERFFALCERHEVMWQTERSSAPPYIHTLLGFSHRLRSRHRGYT